MKKIFFVLSLVTLLLSGCQDAKQNNLRYISYNIRYSRANDGDNSWLNRRQATLTMLRKEQPSLFGLQEAYIEQVKFIEDSLTQYSRVGVGREDGVDGGEFMALFFLKDRFDLIDHGDFWLNETTDVPQLGWDAACVRIVTWACLKDKVTNKELYAFNTHLDHVGKVAREQSILLIISKIKEITQGKEIPILLSGDFNSNSDNPIFDPLKSFMEDSRVTANTTDNKQTFNGFGKANPNNDNTIDFIFYKNAKAVTFTTLDGDYGVPFISDHYPVMTDFKL